METPKCPKCESTKYARERRPDGDTTCLDCDYTGKSKEWDVDASEFVALRETITLVSEKNFNKMIEGQRGKLDEKFLMMLQSSEFFKGMYEDAFTAGVNFGGKLAKP